MIIQSLVEYYDHCGKTIPLGWMEEDARWIIVLNAQGVPTLLKFTGSSETFIDSTGKEKTREVFPKFIVPVPKKRTSGIVANLLWESDPEYIFGNCDGKPLTKKQKDKTSLFQARLQKLGNGTPPPEISAVLTFLQNSPWERLCSACPDEAKDLAKEIVSPAKKQDFSVTFQMETDACILLERPDIHELCDRVLKDGEVVKQGRCAFSGENGDLIAVHDNIIGRDAFLTFQADRGFYSYGKKQGLNAPMCWEVMKKYTAALRYLLNSEDQCIPLSKKDNEYLMFWATRPDPRMNQLKGFLKPQHNVRKVKTVYESPSTGTLPPLVDRNYFYLLGIAHHPGSGDRLMVRTWVRSSLEEASQNIANYFEALELVKPRDDYLPISLPWILRSTFPFRSKKKDDKDEKDDNPHLGQLNAEILDAAIQGKRFPRELLVTLTNRLCLDRMPSSNDDSQKQEKFIYGMLSYVRTAMLKAYLIRNLDLLPERKPKVMLDPNNLDPAYNLGRLFAVLERTQECALSSDKRTLNKTLKDRFLSAIATRPLSIFDELMRISLIYAERLKDNNWTRYYNRFETHKTAIFSHLSPDNLPRTLSPEERAFFHIGYYHQRQKLLQEEEECRQQDNQAEESSDNLQE